MVETKNKADLLKLLVELGRGPSHLEGLNINLIYSYFWIFI
jgi:hypothetical protein